MSDLRPRDQIEAVRDAVALAHYKTVNGNLPFDEVDDICHEVTRPYADAAVEVVRPLLDEIKRLLGELEVARRVIAKLSTERDENEQLRGAIREMYRAASKRQEQHADTERDADAWKAAAIDAQADLADAHARVTELEAVLERENVNPFLWRRLAGDAAHPGEGTQRGESK